MSRLAAVCGSLALSGLFGVLPASANDLAAVVKRIERHYRPIKTLRAEFIQRWSDSPTSVRLESGIVSFERPRAMRWDYREPQPKLFLSDGKRVYFYVPADRIVRRSLLRDTVDWRVPLAWLAGNVRLRKLFGRIEWAPLASPVQGKPGHGPPRRALRGLPRSLEDGYKEAILEFNDGFQLTRLLIRDTVGREIEFRFGPWEENLPLGAQAFHFTVPPGVAVVDEADLVGLRE
jgi:outer membrane lipoprotein carrier protein